MGSATLAQSVAASLVWESVNKNTHTPTRIRRENLKSASRVLSRTSIVSRAAGSADRGARGPA